MFLQGELGQKEKKFGKVKKGKSKQQALTAIFQFSGPQRKHGHLGPLRNYARMQKVHFVLSYFKFF